MTIQIDGLSPAEKTLLNIIWKCDSREDLAKFYGKQNRVVKKKLDLLIELLCYAYTDEEVERAGHTVEACHMLKQIGIDCYPVSPSK